MPQTQSELPRVLNASHATSIVVGIIIGSGIFLVPREMMAAVGSSRMVYAVWIIGGLLSLFGAMTYAEIAAARPRYGGEYAFLREAYGDLTGFLYMWTQITVAKPASLATIAAGLARVLGTFAIFSSFARPAFAHLLWAQVFAIATTWLTQIYQSRTQRVSQGISQREHLFCDFITLASKLYADALTHEAPDPPTLVPLYALKAQMSLFAAKATVDGADEVMRRIVDTYYKPGRDFRKRQALEDGEYDLLQDFTFFCREELATDVFGGSEPWHTARPRRSVAETGARHDGVGEA